jgi:hypothetical protein
MPSPTRAARPFEESWALLCASVPRSLHRRVKLHCTTCGIRLSDFTAAAVQEKFTRERGTGSSHPSERRKRHA